MVERISRCCAVCHDQFQVSVKSKKTRCYGCSAKSSPRPRLPPVDRSICADCGGPTDFWWIGRYSQVLRRCHPCHLARMREKYYAKSGGSPRREAAPKDTRRRCRACGTSYQVGTPGSTIGSACSTTCSDALRRDRYRRKNNRRRLAKTKSRREAYKLVDIAKRDGHRCHLCGKRVDMRLPGTDMQGPTIDHLLPLSAGGADAPDNVALAHRLCNVRRGAGGVVHLRLVA